MWKICPSSPDRIRFLRSIKRGHFLEIKLDETLSCGFSLITLIIEISSSLLRQMGFRLAYASRFLVMQLSDLCGRHRKRRYSRYLYQDRKLFALGLGQVAFPDAYCQQHQAHLCSSHKFGYRALRMAFIPFDMAFTNSQSNYPCSKPRHGYLVFLGVPKSLNFFPAQNHSFR